MNHLEVKSVLSPRRPPLSEAPVRQIEAGSSGERRSGTTQTRSSRCTLSTRRRRDTRCLRRGNTGRIRDRRVSILLHSSESGHRRTNSGTFHFVLLGVEEDGGADVVVTFQLGHRFESDERHSRIFKLLDGVHLVPLHNYLFFTIHLQPGTNK